MKKIIFLGLVLLLVASSTGFSQNIPLPKDIEIKVPSPQLLKEIAAFSGKWKGSWRGIMDIFIVVTEIDQEKAEIIYAHPDSSVWNLSGRYIYETGKVIPGEKSKIQFRVSTGGTTLGGKVLPGSGAWITLEIQKDLKNLKAIYEDPKRKADGTLEKTE
jgi:hypothetical protein